MSPMTDLLGSLSQRWPALLSGRLALALVSTMVALVAIEFVARIILPLPRYHERLLEFDRELGFRGIPNASFDWRSPIEGEPGHTVRLNVDGFRGRALPSTPAHPKEKRIAFIGDSFLVGLAVPDEATLPALIEKKLTALGESPEVYNASAIDYGTVQQLLLLDQIGEQLSPDLFVLVLHPTNDIANNSLGLAGRTRVSPGDAIRPYVRFGETGDREILWTEPLRASLRAHSRVFGQLERDLFPPVFDRVSAGNPAERVRHGRVPREFLEVFTRHDPGHRWEIAWRETDALLRAFRDRCTEIGAELLVVVVPSIHQVVTTPKRIRFESEVRSTGRSLSELVNWNSPEIRLGQFFEREGIDSVLLLDPFREARSEGNRIYARDRHLSRAGNELAAQIVAGAIQEGRDVPKTPVVRRYPHPVEWSEKEDPSWLDFAREPKSKHVGDGFIAWQSENDPVPGGWLLRGEGLVALRSAEGNLVIRGQLASPVELEVGVIGVSGERVSFQDAGPFEVKLPYTPIRVASAPTHVPVGIRIVGDASTILVQEVGFESARPAP